MCCRIHLTKISVLLYISAFFRGAWFHCASPPGLKCYRRDRKQKSGAQMCEDSEAIVTLVFFKCFQCQYEAERLDIYLYLFCYWELSE